MQERAQRDDVELAPALEQEQAKETEQPVRETPVREKPVREQIASGAPPEVAGPDVAPRDRSASQLAYEEDGNAKELKEKVTRLVNREFGGDFKKAFEYYAAQGSDNVDKYELRSLLADAGVGNGITRGAWADGIIGKLDTDGDKKIQWEEFEKVAAKKA